jgi:hypothetical protein
MAVAESGAGSHEGEAAAGGVQAHRHVCYWCCEAAGVRSRSPSASQAALRWPDRVDGEGQDDQEGGEIRERHAPRMLGTKLVVLFLLAADRATSTNQRTYDDDRGRIYTVLYSPMLN